MKTVKLPKGHEWIEVNVGASVIAFECVKCEATFTHDLQDGSYDYVGSPCEDDA